MTHTLGVEKSEGRRWHYRNIYLGVVHEVQGCLKMWGKLYIT